MDRPDADQAGSTFGAILKRRWPYVATIAPTAVLLSVYFAFAIPAVFRSSATIMLEPSSVQNDLVNTTVASYANRQIEIVQAKVMTVSALKGLVAQYDPYPQEKSLSQEAKAQRIIQSTSFERVDPVTMKTLIESTAFSVYYDNPDPKRAAETTSMIADLFLTYNQKSRAESARQTAAFLAEQAKGVTAELQSVDAQLAQIKTKYGDAAPDAQLRNQANLDRAQRDLDGTTRDIRTAEEREKLLVLQLAQISPNLVSIGGDFADINKVRAQLADAERRYTPDHPDVKRLRRAMADLIARNATGGQQMAKPTNPDYLRVESQLDGTRRELSALRASAGRSNAQISTYMQNLSRSPVVEKEFSDVNRRREVLQQQFQGLQERLRNAQLAQSFESESRGERFSLVHAPYPSKLPEYPNRIGLILLGLILGGGLTAAAVAIVESSDSTVRGAGDMPSVPGVGVLGNIPVILTLADRRKRTLLWTSISAVYAVAVVIVGFTVAAAT